MKPDKLMLRELSVKHLVDTRTLQKVLDGQPVRAMARRRAVAALREAGIDVPEPADRSRHDAHVMLTASPSPNVLTGEPER